MHTAIFRDRSEGPCTHAVVVEAKATREMEGKSFIRVKIWSFMQSDKMLVVLVYISVSARFGGASALWNTLTVYLNPLRVKKRV